MSERHLLLLRHTQRLWLFFKLYGFVYVTKEATTEPDFKRWAMCEKCTLYVHMFTFEWAGATWNMFSVYNLTSQGGSMWRVCTCVVQLSQAHLFFSGLYVQDHVSGSAVWEYRPAFCVWLTGVRPSCTLSLITFRTHVLNLGQVSTLILTKKGHITYIQMFVSLRCFQCVKYSCLPCAFYM